MFDFTDPCFKPCFFDLKAKLVFSFRSSLPHYLPGVHSSSPEVTRITDTKGCVALNTAYTSWKPERSNNNAFSLSQQNLSTKVTVKQEERQTCCNLGEGTCRSSSLQLDLLVPRIFSQHLPRQPHVRDPWRRQVPLPPPRTKLFVLLLHYLPMFPHYALYLCTLQLISCNIICGRCSPQSPARCSRSSHAKHTQSLGVISSSHLTFSPTSRTSLSALCSAEAVALSIQPGPRPFLG